MVPDFNGNDIIAGNVEFKLVVPVGLLATTIADVGLDVAAIGGSEFHKGIHLEEKISVVGELGTSGSDEESAVGEGDVGLSELRSLEHEMLSLGLI